ncbi:putative receptor like protein 25 [Amaranthus tricolor]|uniref:putative receptor like protein 25 n=1 Tax=Amaranthus tricolor TaxID=29722 RepID=UPI00258A0E1F|nr:putative receptor like protein 25 [Amaranthus tricolor]
MSTIGSPRHLENEFINNEFGNYMYSFKMIVKGKELDYKKIITSMSTFDMSNNHFEGEIPNSIGMLRALRNLNLSHNLLTGNIPPSIENLSLLDGLDLSSNRLIGEISQELVSLTFLGVFNVSYNQLEGPIPHGNNFDTFSFDSYEGNLELCGVPLLECKKNTVVQSLNNDNVEEKTELSMWEVVVIGFGSGTIVGLAWGFINGRILSEQETLLAIKSAIKDDPHKSLSSWKNTTHHCNWSFVTCSSSSHSPAVISLNFYSLELSGTLSTQINFLTNLQNLSLPFNNFYGHVPSSLSLLTKLQYLELEFNQFSGPLPYDLGFLKRSNMPTLEASQHSLLSGIILK